jgi:hypothetical protein
VYIADLVYLPVQHIYFFHFHLQLLFFHFGASVSNVWIDYLFFLLLFLLIQLLHPQVQKPVQT